MAIDLNKKKKLNIGSLLVGIIPLCLGAYFAYDLLQGSEVKDEADIFVHDFSSFLAETNSNQWANAYEKLIPTLREKVGFEQFEQVVTQSSFLGKGSRFKMFKYRKRGGAAVLEGNLLGRDGETWVVVHYSTHGPKDQKGRSEFFISEMVVGGQPLFSMK